MNNATFAGNIGQDCRVNTVNTNSGQKTVVNFSLAVDKRQKDQNVQRQTLWVDCALWGARAEALQQYLVKGQKVAVSGSVDVDSYQKQDGTVIPKLNLMVNDVTLMGSRDNATPNQQQNTQQRSQGGYNNQQQRNQPPQQGQAAPDFDFDSDIPF